MKATKEQLEKWEKEFESLHSGLNPGVQDVSQKERDAYIAGCEARWNETDRVLKWLDNFCTHAKGLSRYVSFPQLKKTLPPDLVTDIQDLYSFQCMVETCLYGQGVKADFIFIDEPEDMKVDLGQFLRKIEPNEEVKILSSEQIKETPQNCRCQGFYQSPNCPIHGFRAK